MARQPYQLVASRRGLTLAALSAILVASSACDDGVNRTSEPRESGTRVLLTSSPSQYAEIARADVFVVRVSAVQLDGAEQTIVEPNRFYDLVAPQNGRTADLGHGVLSPGSYAGVTLTIDFTRSKITLKDGTVLTDASLPGIQWWGVPGIPSPVNVPKAELYIAVSVESAIEIIGSRSQILIDVDLARSFFAINPSNLAAGFEFRPLAFAVDVAKAPTLTGIVVGEGGAPLVDAAVYLYAEPLNSTFPMPPSYASPAWRGARTDAAGRFRFDALQPGRTYLVAAEGALAADYAWSGTTRVATATSTEVSAGTITVPRYDPSTLPGTYVLRLVGPPGLARGLPAPVGGFPIAGLIYLDADTLTLRADGTGTEVRVEHTRAGGPRKISTDFTFTRTGRLLTLIYPCATGATCVPPPHGVLDASGLAVYWPEENARGPVWPRAWERVGP
jgi:hypothetical protein